MDKDKEDQKAEDEEAEEKGGEDEVVEEVKSILNDKVKVAVQDLKNDVKSELEDKVKSYIDEQEDVAEKKAGLYHEDIKASRKAMNDVVRKNIETALGERQKADGMSTADDGYGGYTVTEELDAEIRALTQEYGVARDEFFVTPLEQNAYRVNHLVSDIAAAWVSEGDEFTTDRVQIGSDKLELKKLGVIVALSNELLSDTEADLTRFVTERVANAFAENEDEAAFVGDGSDSYGGHTGIMNAATQTVWLGDGAGSGDTSFSDVTLADILEARDEVEGKNVQPKIYLNREIKTVLRTLTDSNNRYILDINDGQEEIWGMPVVEVDAMPDMSDDAAGQEFILVGDLEKASIMGYKGGFTIDEFDTGRVQLEDSTGAYMNLLTSDRKALRFKERVGFANVNVDAVAVVRTASS